MTSTDIALQLYSVRELASADLEQCLNRAAMLGFKAVEPYRAHASPQEHGELLSQLLLTAPSMHARFIGHPPEEQHGLFRQAKLLGIKTVIHPASDKGWWNNEPQVRQFADQTNHSLLIADEYGVEIGYHNHGFELEAQLGQEPAYLLYSGLISPRVLLQIDVFWAAVGGVDPVELITRLGARVGSMHLKDAVVEDTHSSQNLPAQLPLGQGNIDIPGALRAAPQATRIIEFDSYEGDLWEAISMSLGYLQEVDRWSHQ